MEKLSEFEKGQLDVLTLMEVKNKKNIEYEVQNERGQKKTSSKEESIEDLNFETAQELTTTLTKQANLFMHNINGKPYTYTLIEKGKGKNKDTLDIIEVGRKDIVLPNSFEIVETYKNLDAINRFGELKKLMYGLDSTPETKKVDRYFKTIVGDFLKSSDNDISPNFENVEILFDKGLKLLEKSKNAEEKGLDLSKSDTNALGCIQAFFNGMASTFNHNAMNQIFSDEKDVNQNNSDELADIEVGKRSGADDKVLVEKDYDARKGVESYKFSETGKDIMSYTNAIDSILMDSTKPRMSKILAMCGTPDAETKMNVYEKIIADEVENKYKTVDLKKKYLASFGGLFQSVYGYSEKIDSIIRARDIDNINDIKKDIRAIEFEEASEKAEKLVKTYK